MVSPPTPQADVDVAVDQFTLQLDTSLTMTGSLAQKSELIDNGGVAELSPFLPRRQQHADWKLSYSTYEHGMSLSALFRKLSGQCALSIISHQRLRATVFCCTSDLLVCVYILFIKWQATDSRGPWWGAPTPLLGGSVHPISVLELTKKTKWMGVFILLLLFYHFLILL